MKKERVSHQGIRRVAGSVLAIVLAMIVIAPGAVAHVGTDFGHLWTQHIKPRIATPGTINAATNPVDWTKLKGVPAGMADGLDNAVDQAVGTIGGGPDPSAVAQFFGSPATVTVTSASQRVLVNANSIFGTHGAPAYALNLFICYQPLPSGAVTPVGNGILGNKLPANTQVPMGMSKMLQLPAGEHRVGLCGTGGVGWDGDWGTTTALVVTT